MYNSLRYAGLQQLISRYKTISRLMAAFLEELGLQYLPIDLPPVIVAYKSLTNQLPICFCQVK